MYYLFLRIVQCSKRPMQKIETKGEITGMFENPIICDTLNGNHKFEILVKPTKH